MGVSPHPTFCRSGRLSAEGGIMYIGIGTLILIIILIIIFT
jgi:hypothetical protein